MATDCQHSSLPGLGADMAQRNPVQPTYPAGTVLVFDCAEGYQMTRPGSVQCNATVWTPPAPGSCVAPPPNPQDTDVTQYRG